MQEISVLTGGKVGSGIDRATLILGHLLNRCGYRIYIYHDYPSLIRGGHTFSIIQAAQTRIGAHREKIDILRLDECRNPHPVGVVKGTG